MNSVSGAVRIYNVVCKPTQQILDINQKIKGVSLFPFRVATAQLHIYINKMERGKSVHNKFLSKKHIKLKLLIIV